uniref:Extended synaptotagmin-2 n=1 Tax=Timema cristinae TaxID=61476 RepID=A0A7R9CVL2_TIMCR|nr:unnamed protein product [Timema cristinae]
MAGASKEDGIAAQVPKKIGGMNILSVLYSFAKKFGTVAAVYLLGYYDLSVAWIIGPVILSVIRDEFKKESELRRNIAKAAAMSNEKEVILARVDDLPSWVFFPDVERVEWLNRILRQVWPNLNHWAKGLLKDTIEPSVRDALIAYKLHGFRFDKMILGSILANALVVLSSTAEDGEIEVRISPLRVGGVKVYDRNVDRNEIILDMDLLIVKGASCLSPTVMLNPSIRTYQIASALEVLLDKKQLSSVQVDVVKRDYLDFASKQEVIDYLKQFTSSGDQLDKFFMNIFSRIHGMMRVVLKPLIQQMPLVGGIQLFFLNNPTIDFNLVGVADLLDMPGLSDLLRRVIVEQIANMMVLPNKLPIKLSDLVPSRLLKIPEPEGVLRVHIVEAKDLMKKDITMLGKGKSDPYAIVSVGAQEFRTHTIDNSINPKWDFWCEGVLRVHIVEAKDLMKKDITMLGKGKSDPYAIVSVGAQEFRTHTIDNSINPKWDFWCESIVFEPHGQLLEIKLLDADDVADDENLGSLYDVIIEPIKLTAWINFALPQCLCRQFEVEDLGGQILHARLFDKDPGEDDFLGRATVDVSNVVKKGKVDLWLNLEQAKHGMVHIRLLWLRLSSDIADLKAAIIETQELRVTSMSTALLTVFVDSAKNLPEARPGKKPDSYVVLSVSKKEERTNMQSRTPDPVWEQGYTFLVNNPESDTLHVKVLDQKTEIVIGTLVYNLNQLLELKDMSLDSQPHRLTKSGPDAKIILSLQIKILKHEETVEDSSLPNGEGKSDILSAIDNIGSLARIDSLKKPPSTPSKSIGESSPLKKQGSKESLHSGSSLSQTHVDDVMTVTTAPPPVESSPPTTLRNRMLSDTSSAGEAGLGRIQLTLRYSVQRQRLIIVVHKIANLPLRDPANIPDPYVKLYLLPERSKDSKRKTETVKDNCNPVYDHTIEYIMSQGELNSKQLEVSVVTRKGLFSSGSPVIGQALVNLADYDLNKAVTSWYDLLPEVSRD